MKLAFVGLLLTLLCTLPVFAQADEITIIPKPNFVKRGRGEFVLDNKTLLVAKGPVDARGR